VVPGDVVGNYRIVQRIGEGGMGEVYLATDVRLGRKVALKVISEKVFQSTSQRERFKQEAPSAAALNHPNICAVYDVGEWQGRPYIAMEYLDGVTLHQMIRSQILEVPRIIDITLQIADALEEARKSGIIHRDIKSSNILLTKTKMVKLVDFGLAKREPQNSQIFPGPRPSEPGVVLGTIDSMSPEQALGRDVDHRSDLFSLGVALYEMLTGRLPFTSSAITETLDGILHAEPQSIRDFRSDTPERLIRITKKLLEKRREDRYETAGELWTELNDLRYEITQPTIERRSPSKKLLWLVLAAMVVSMTLLLLSNVRLPGLGKGEPRLDKIESLLALPCKVYGAPEVNYLTDAIPSSLSTLLARVEQLETRIPPTSFEVEKVRGDISKIAAAYHVSTFVMSSLTKESNRLILDVQIVDAKNKKVLWSNQYNGTLQSYRELTRQAAEGIRQVIRPSSSSIQIASIPGIAANSEAELSFRRGKFHYNRYDSFRHFDDFTESSNAFKRALDLDPRLADAAAEIGSLYYLKFEISRKKEDLAGVEQWAKKALSIDPNCAVAWTDLALIELASPVVNMEKLLAPALKAATLGGDEAINQMTLSLALASSSIILSVRAAEQTHNLDPLYPYATVSLMDELLISGRYAEALPMVEDVLRLEPDLPISLFYKSLILSNLNRTKESAAILNQLDPIVGAGRFHRNLFDVARHVQALQSKQYAQADRINDKLIPNTNPATVLFRAVFVAPVLVRHNKHDQAVEILKRGLGVNMLPHDLFFVSPEIKGLSQDSRIQPLYLHSAKRFKDVLMILNRSKKRGELPAYLEAPLVDLLKRTGL
jgi:eukaryotic-like serine/threonine-protein kinase